MTSVTCYIGEPQPKLQICTTTASLVCTEMGQLPLAPHRGDVNECVSQQLKMQGNH